MPASGRVQVHHSAEAPPGVADAASALADLVEARRLLARALPTLTSDEAFLVCVSAGCTRGFLALYKGGHPTPIAELAERVIDRAEALLLLAHPSLGRSKAWKGGRP